MFEAHVLHLLRRYLGEYVHGLSAEALRISVWKGDVVLKDLKLKSEALNSLKLPLTVKAGFVGTITLKVPWKSLGKEPVIVLIDRVFVLAHPASDYWTLKEEDRDKLFEAKLQQIEEAESATIEAIAKSKLGTQTPGNSWLGSLIATIIGNLKISISNVHIRYEDCDSNICSPFSAGVTLAKLAAVTMDDQENETFDASGALDRLRKSVQLERLALYHDCNSLPWTIDKRWGDLSPKEWVEIFEDGINVPVTDMMSKRSKTRSYIVSPINGVLKYHRLGKQERNDPETPFERVSVTLSDVSLTVTEAQYHDWIKLLEAVNRYQIYVEVLHLRPMVSVSEGPHLWWRYAAQATLQQKKMCYRFSWDQIQHLCLLRRRYVQLYACFLQQLSDIKISDLREIERDLDPKVIILWRLLAHAKVESVRSKEAAEQRRLQKRSWFSFRRQTATEDTSGIDSEGSQMSEGKLTKEEWHAINKLLSYQQDEEFVLHSVKDMQNVIRFLVTVSVGQVAARIVNKDDIEIVCARFEQLLVSTKLRHRSTHCDVSLKFYGLSAPEGSLAESVSSEQKVNALIANFISSPAGENVDWRLSATTSPCHVTVLMESYNRFTEFVRRSNAVSPTVALETAAALQTRIERVTRIAQEQFQMVLEEKSRFALDIDLDAPKIRFPLRTCDSSKCESHLLFDLGNFTLRTKDDHLEDQRQNIYSRFYISGRDIAACFTERGSDCLNGTLFLPSSSNYLLDSPLEEKADCVCSLVDNCSVAVIVDKIKVPHPSFPSTRISIQVPNLGIHFSPSRYHRLVELLNIWYGAMEIPRQGEADSFQTELAHWSAIELANDAKILVWRGIGNLMSKWQPCFLMLSGFHLYVLESAKSQSYQRFLSMAGRQIHEVPPGKVGGSPFCIAVSFRGMNIQKALETSSTWVLGFQDEDEKNAWWKGLVQATYQASAPPSVDVLGELSEGVSELSNSQAPNFRTADLVINGSLVETKLFIYAKTAEIDDKNSKEALILEILADGGKVHVICWESNLTIKTKLHSLKIKDELRGSLSAGSEYLAYSVQNHDNLAVSSGKNNFSSTVISSDQIEEDDIFGDALSDFMSTDSPSPRTGDMNNVTSFDSSDVTVSENDFGKGRGFSADVFYEAEDNDSSDFVSVNFSTRNSSSPDYDGIDTQMTISMSRLEFFCNRPTVVALIGFGMDLSSSSVEEGRGPNIKDNPEREDLLNKEKVDDNQCVKGLLGYGKGRVVFNLQMNVSSVCLFLNKEDGSQLAMLVQENFLLDLKVYPGSLTIEGTLGNFKLSDKSLGTDSCWSWLCDIRNPGVESLIKFKFDSYSAEDDDYEGYNYSLHGRLSAVRIVFLYRFVQEVTVYFMGLASPQTEEAIKLVDKVGGFEWLIQKYEIDGSSAVKLDLSLDTPIIIIPKTSASKDFIQLDLGQLQVRNELRWHGYPEEDPSAVRVDVLHAEILGINMTIGIDGHVGKPMIRKGRGLDVFVRRSLRDVFRKVPNFSLEVKIGLLHGVMLDKEYNVIRDCLSMNLYEQPRLPKSFRGSSSSSEDTMRLLVDKVNMNSQMLLSRTVTIVAVEVNYALLELCNGIDEEAPLARIALERLWVSYRTTSLSEADLYVTIPTFSILDIRPETKSEMRLMLGSSSDSSKPAAMGDLPYSSNSYSHRRRHSEVGLEMEAPSPTMFLMDYRYRSSSQSFVVRIQQPRILVVPDFLLALGEFFVPALGAITGREETQDPKNDPITKRDNIILSEPIYKQHEDVVRLSPNRQLVADAVGVDEYTYDGCGKIICLSTKLELSESHISSCEPVILIGRGKKLRFVNVKIENGSLLKECTYLSNDSSYSVAFEDGVDILSLEKSGTDIEQQDLDQQTELSDSLSPHFPSQSDSSSTQSFTFEGQVLSPEFTFYDSTKSFLDDTYQGEKLLRVKMDVSFMYATKENDTWIRALLKDLMIESGSGLTVLDPVDVSGGYTSVREKTSISLLSTDICIHLSLSALSLVINLLNQVAMALQFGNTAPLASCTNFDRIWVYPEESGPSYNLTFWRPRAPSNYVVLGDCVTSRPIPPSQAVMAVCNTYGRVRKPVGFNLIGVLSSIKTIDKKDLHISSDTAKTCSIWMPVPPPGYKALGYVANLGEQPPQNHVVFCLRADLVTSAMFSECIYTTSPNLMFPSGFSIWRLDNVVSSFYASPTINFPPKDYGLDLSHVILWGYSQHSVSSKQSAGLGSGQDHDGNQQMGGQSGWDVLRSISKATSCYMSTPHFERIWWDKGNDVRRPVSIWRPVARSGYAVLGDCITEGLEPPALGIVFKADNTEIAEKPVQFTKVAQIVGRGFDEIFFWYPVAPPGYVTMGCVVSRSEDPPSPDLFCCPRMDLVKQANIFELPSSRSSSSRAAQCWSIWRVENQACTFLARSDFKKPSSRLAFTICDSVKPKARENVSAEMRLRRFSFTVLDSSCGMITPLLDSTITNIKLATHGRPEAMNAVFIASIAASTFNTQQEAWEPLVEPFDGIFKLETYATNEHSTPLIGKRVRISATSILNINVSAANLDMFGETAVSWRRIMELEDKAAKLNQEVGQHNKNGEDQTFSALDEDDFQTIVVENKLGCVMYLKKVDENEDTVDLLHPDDHALVWVPPPRFADRLNIADEFREARHYVSVQILEAKGIPTEDDGNSHNFFCALRLVIDNQAMDQQKLFPQSARTRCCKPLISKDEAIVKWNELFVFEVPRKGSAKLEVEVTNLAAKAGKGEVIGAFSFPVGHGASTLKKVASGRIVHQLYDMQKVASYPLKRRDQHGNNENIPDCGVFSVSTQYFERKSGGKISDDVEYENGDHQDIGFWVGINPDGAWEGVRSLLPLSVVPRSFDNDFIAMEVIMKNGRKHAVFRGLVTVVNDSDVKLEVAICPLSLIKSNDSFTISRGNILVEEVFQNQYYHPADGWGGKQLGSHINDPGQWSTRDFSYSSKDFFEPAIPLGWQWTSTWAIDKSHPVDAEGWAYGPDFQSLRWPPTSKSSSKSSCDTVRRRRWTRPRQQLIDQAMDKLNSGLTTINPRCCVALPWKSTLKDSEECFLVRPSVDSSEMPYSWGRAVALSSFNDQSSSTRQTAVRTGDKLIDYIFKLNHLEKKDILLICSRTGNKQFWLSVGTDASILHTELNSPIYDWRISVNSPLELENRLPSIAEFTLWERTKEGNFIDRGSGVIPSRKVVHIYSADLQKPLYISFFVHGGWVLEKDPVLVLDPSSTGRISSFWIVHQQSRRKLRVNVEYDLGENNAAPKAIRLFIPYWIVNDTYLPLVYRTVELEYSENADPDALRLSRAVRSAKTALRNPSLSRKYSTSRRNVQVLEVLEDSGHVPSMLSPQDYFGGNALLFSSQKDAYISPRVGIGVAVRNSDIYSPGISLLELENKERIDVMAYTSDESYYKLAAYMKTTSDRTKVIHFQPHTLFINRVGSSICLQQCDSQKVQWIDPTDPPKVYPWESMAKDESLMVRMDGYKWSRPFSVSTEGVMRVCLQNEIGGDDIQLRIQVRSGAKGSRYEVIFRPNSFSSPYRIENRSLFLPIHFRQEDSTSDTWKFLLPNAAASFFWDDIGRKRILEVLVAGNDAEKTEKYNIDEISDYQPFHVEEGPIRALHVSVFKEEKLTVVRFTDWMPENEPSVEIAHRFPSPLPQLSGAVLRQQTQSTAGSEFHFIVDFAELGISLIDHTPEEILYMSVQNLMLAYSTGLGSEISRFKIRLRSLQVDNQLPLTPMPVLFRPQRVGDETDYVFKLSVTQQSNGSHDLCVYPYIGIQGPESSAFLINIHEPIIWRLHEMIQQVNLSRLYESQTTAVSVDPVIQIGVLDLSEVRFKISMTMSPGQRPRGVLGFWSSLMTALGNTENMPVKINQRFHENVSMRQSSMISNATLNVRKDLLSQPLQLLSGVDILGNASSALGHMSKGVAALSMDKRFIQSRQRQENKGVEDISDVIREGGGALAKGLFRGVTGILTKPLEGAKSSGVEGFVQGFGKGIIGAAAQPVSGVLDLLSKTTEGANAMRMKIIAAITSEDQLLRRRLPRVIGADILLRPYDEYKAEGQVILQLAECGSFFGQVDLFRVRGKFALSDAFEDHFILPKGKIVVITHRRVILLQQTSNIMAQKKFNPARDPCSVLWDVLWDDLVTMELMHGKNDAREAPPSRLILYLKARAPDQREQIRKIKCNRDTHQAQEVYSAIERSTNTYGPVKAKGMLKGKVTKPYMPGAEGTMAEVVSSREPAAAAAQAAIVWSPQQVPMSSTFGSNSTS
ncbi:hypothetical protein SAY86_030760 [Trapa natans]|uniref:C2 domain-containing protein n=1 Tax=Trapa natans TaxID=22666 RepID=A0AAN7M5N7_TRANT|nr:hypothetical protein SAY86_030760 [Trapa natans]